MNKDITLRFTYTETDYIAAMRLFYTAVRKLHITLDSVLGLAGLTIGAVGTLLWGPDWIWTLLMIAGAALLVIVFLALYAIPRVVFHRQPKFRDEYLLRFTEDGIEFKTTGIDSKLEWSYYDRLVEDDETFLLVYGGGFTAIPKRVFADREEMDAFRELAASRIALR